jgi:hypothetical protein
MNPRTNAEMASRIVDRLLILEQRRVAGKPVCRNRGRVDFDAWLLELDQPSRARLDRFLEFAANAIALGEGSANPVP